MHGCSDTRLAFDAHGPAHGRQKLSGKAKTESDALLFECLSVELNEGIDFSKLIGSHSSAAIGDR
jgi:hypothetical protein